MEWNKVTTFSKTLALVLVFVVFALGFYLGQEFEASSTIYNSPSIVNIPSSPKWGLIPKDSNFINDVVFDCPDGKFIHAVFKKSRVVDLELSDGRKMSLPQAISASGARYANADESFVFWNKGEGAFIQENGTITYQDCVIRPSGR